MDNVWNAIPLKDYERHMQHDSVGQQQLLSELTKRYLAEMEPKVVLFLGISGGNGLEHVDNSITNHVLDL